MAYDHYKNCILHPNGKNLRLKIGMMRALPLGSNNPVAVTPEQYEKQVVSWLHEMKGEVTEISVRHLERLEGNPGEYVIDAVARLTIFDRVEVVVLVECKKLKRPVERDVVMTLNSKIQATGSHKGIVFSTSGFQSGAIDYAAEHGIALIEFIDGKHTFFTRSVEEMPNKYLPTDAPRYVGIWEFSTETGLSFITISTQNTERLYEWLAN